MPTNLPATFGCYLSCTLSSTKHFGFCYFQFHHELKTIYSYMSIINAEHFILIKTKIIWSIMDGFYLNLVDSIVHAPKLLWLLMTTQQKTYFVDRYGPYILSTHRVLKCIFSEWIRVLGEHLFIYIA